MSLKSSVNTGHHPFHENLLEVDVFQESRKPWPKYRVHGIRGVKVAHPFVRFLRLHVGKESCSNGPHPLAITAFAAVQREAVQHVEQGSLTKTVPSAEHNVSSDGPRYIQVDLDVKFGRLVE